MTEVEYDYGALFEDAPCGYLVTDAAGLIGRANRTFLSWTGYDSADLVGVQRFQDLLSPGGRLFYESHLAPLLGLQGYLREVAVELQCRDDRRLVVLVNAAADPRPDGAAGRVRIVVIDATERRAYELELQRTQRRLERLQRIAGAFAGAMSRDEVAAAALDEIVDGIKADHGLLAVLDEDGVLRVLAQRGGTDDVVSAWTGLRGDAHAPLDAALRLDEPAFLDGSGEGLPPLAPGPASLRVAVLPLTVDRQAIGVMALGSLVHPAFDREERTFLAAFAELCAQALERARLHDSATVSAQRMAMLANLTRALDEATTFRERAQRLVDLLVPAVADYATVEVPSMGPEPVALRHRDPVMAETLRLLRTSVEIPADRPHSLAAARQSGRPQILTDVPDAMYEAYQLDPVQLARLRSLAPRSYVGLPLIDRGRLVGSLMLVSSSSDRRYDHSDLAFFTEISDRAALALENARLYDHERTVSSELQGRLISHEMPVDPRLRVDALYQPGAEMVEVGGDWHDAFFVGPDRLGVVVGDVVGRGVRAAAVMGQLRTALRAYAMEGLGVARTLERLDGFSESIDGALCTTVVYAELDLRTGALHYACAGHPPPMVLGSAADDVVLWGGRSTVLGVDPEAPKPEARVDLAAGTGVLLYTDGLIENRQRPIGVGIDALGRRIVEGGRRVLDEPLEELADEMISDESDADDVCALRLVWVG